MSLFNDPASAGSRTSTVTVSSFLDLFSEVTEEGNGYVVICPSHTDTKPSLRVGYNADEKKLALKCRAGCSTTDVVAKLNLTMSDLFNVEPGDATHIRIAATDTAGPSTGDRAALAMYLERTAAQLTNSIGGFPALEYAERRFGITADKASELGLGYDDGTVDGGKLKLSRALYHDTPRLVVPFYDFEGNPHYLQARALSGTPKAKWSGPTNPEGATWGKYGFFHGGSGWAEVIVTEGPGDALTAAAVGYDVVLIRGAGLGTNKVLADELVTGLRGRRVVVAGDSDSAGLKFTRDVAEALSTRGLDVARLAIPADAGSDITDWREQLGEAFAKTFIRAVQEAPRYGSDEITVEAIAQDVTRLFSDVHNARTLLAVVRERGADVRFTTAQGFMVYRPEVGIWAVDDQEWIRSQAQDVAARVQQAVLAQMQTMDARIAGIADKETRQDTGRMLDRQRAKARSGSLVSYVMSTHGINSMLRELQALDDVPATVDDFDRHHDKLAVRNGVVDLETGDLTPFGPVTKRMMITQRVDIDYVPGARNPRWERFLEEVFGEHEGLVDYIQRLVGYGVTGRTSEQCFAILHGTGANGKSVFTDTLSTLFAGISSTAAFETFEAQTGNAIRSDIARLHASRLVYTEEGKQGAPMAEATIKLLTGSGKVTTRFLYAKEFEFRPQFLIIMASNYRPNFRGQDEGMWRRIRYVPFTRFFAPADRDRYLPQKFAGEKVPSAAWREGDDMGDGPAGILAWAVRGAIEWYRRGLDDPAVVTLSTEEYRRTSDALGPFYAEYLVEDQNGRIPGKDVWELYRKWCDEEDLQPKDRWKRATFWQALEERGAVKSAPHGSVSFRGIRRRKPSEHEPAGHSEDDRAPATAVDNLPVDEDGPMLEPFTP